MPDAKISGMTRSYSSSISFRSASPGKRTMLMMTWWSESTMVWRSLLLLLMTSTGCSAMISRSHLGPGDLVSFASSLERVEVTLLSARAEMGVEDTFAFADPRVVLRCRCRCPSLLVGISSRCFRQQKKQEEEEDGCSNCFEFERLVHHGGGGGCGGTSI